MPPERRPFSDTRQFRARTDRRRRPTSAWDAFRLKGRRARPRRFEERREEHFTDTFDSATFVLVLMLLIMTVVDGTMTLMLLGAGCEEVNPAMRYLLDFGPAYFLSGKYALTAAGLPFLLIYRNFTVFGTRFRIGYLIPVFVGLYLALLGYQVALITTDAGPSSPEYRTQDSGLRTQDSGPSGSVRWDSPQAGSSRRTGLAARSDIRLSPES